MKIQIRYYCAGLSERIAVEKHDYSHKDITNHICIHLTCWNDWIPASTGMTTATNIKDFLLADKT
jgi:hypothetical protein